jgi:RNA polymerase sigma-70 factor (ECF subfamily)
MAIHVPGAHSSGEADRPARYWDAESRAWLTALRSTGPDRDAAVTRLHELLLRAARFELSRRHAALSDVADEEIADIAVQAADDAVVAILQSLDDYSGASRFTTWAYKFALLEAGVRARRRAWHGREVMTDSETWPEFEEIADCLTPRQRHVLMALVVSGVPIDVLAERLNTTRAAVYETLHDGRRRLRARLAERSASSGRPRRAAGGSR